jgi:two-component system phosphate regulon response regulator OmpR
MRLLTMSAIAKQKVFVVDDEKQIAGLLSLYLRAEPFDVETFYDASSASQRASTCVPDVLVSDITMPGMDGITLAEALRERNPNCRVMFISGNPNWRVRGDLQSSKLNGATLLLKPFSIKELLCVTLQTGYADARLQSAG